MNENAASSRDQLGEIPDQLEKLDKHISALTDCVEQMSIILAPVLRQSIPSGSVPVEKERMNCELGESLHKLDERILSIERKIISITERLELCGMDNEPEMIDVSSYGR